MIQGALIGKKGSPSWEKHTLLRSEDSEGTCDVIVCLNVHDTGTRGFKLDSCQTQSLLIKMTDARTGSADQIQTLTQLTAICSQYNYSKWHYAGDVWL